MREITAFEMKPRYIVGESDDLIKLREKLLKDIKILEEIEMDYNKNEKEYEQEYKTAKLKYKQNQYIFNYLMLMYNFDKALINKYSLNDPGKKEMKEKGWMLPLVFADSRLKHYGEPEDVETTYVRYFNNSFDILFNYKIMETNDRINDYYHQAIINYKEKNYYSCVVSLFPIIESYHQYINKFEKDEFYRIKENIDSISEKIKSVVNPYSVDLDYYVKLVDQLNDLIKNHYFNKSTSRKNEPKIINRNRIMHGLFTREISEKDCLQLFCVISNLVNIKIILNSDNELQILKKDIEKLEKELKKC